MALKSYRLLKTKSYLQFTEQIDTENVDTRYLWQSIDFIWKAGVQVQIQVQLGTVKKWVPSSHITPTNQVGRKHLCGRG